MTMFACAHQRCRSILAKSQSKPVIFLKGNLQLSTPLLHSCGIFVCGPLQSFVVNVRSREGLIVEANFTIVLPARCNLVIREKKSLATFLANQKWLEHTSFPALGACYTHLLRVMIGSSNCIQRLWLAEVTISLFSEHPVLLLAKVIVLWSYLIVKVYHIFQNREWNPFSE